MGDQQLHMLAYYDGGNNGFGVQQDTIGFDNPTNKNNNSLNNDYDSTNKDYTIYLIGGGALVLFYLLYNKK